MSTPEKQSHHRHNPWAHVTRVRFFWLLVLLIGFILAVPSMGTSERGQWEVMILTTVNFFAAAYVSQGTTRLWTMGLLALALVISGGFYIMDGDPASLLVIILCILLVTLAYTGASVLGYVLDEGEVGIEHIFGAICAYILIAMAFGTLYLILELLVPGSFSGVRIASHSGERPWWQFFYFSFTTLSTVGYGDIAPTTMRARSFVIIEQLVAVFYVAILISRLTGMYTSSSKPRTD
jgi:hypothetical protein